jgi:small subunit ribosomal protein S17
MARELNGEVVSAKGQKTIVVAIQTRKTHPIYKKQYSSTKRIMAHDEDNTAKEGDKVLITECRPLSARKRWTLSKVTEAARVKHVEPEVIPDEKEAKE